MGIFRFPAHFRSLSSRSGSLAGLGWELRMGWDRFRALDTCCLGGGLGLSLTDIMVGRCIRGWQGDWGVTVGFGVIKGDFAIVLRPDTGSFYSRNWLGYSFLCRSSPFVMSLSNHERASLLRASGERRKSVRVENRKTLRPGENCETLTPSRLATRTADCLAIVGGRDSRLKP